MSRPTQWRKSANGDVNRHINVNNEVSQLLPKELEEHKTINNKDGIEWSLHAVQASCQACVGERKIQNNATSIRGCTILRQKACCLSTSQTRPMLSGSASGHMLGTKSSSLNSSLQFGMPINGSHVEKMEDAGKGLSNDHVKK